MAKFKTEFENCTVTVNSPAVGKITINTATVNPNHWVSIKEFAFMFEDETAPEPIFFEVNENLIADSYSDFTLNELRERFPDIKATSKKAFIEQITE
jgi:hypothetical protein